MARRHHAPESVHPHRWMVSYADFMTLLFAFFVVLYAASSVNNEKFDTISKSLVGVFESPAAFQFPIELEQLMPGATLEQVRSEELEMLDGPDLSLIRNNLQALIKENIKDRKLKSDIQLRLSDSWLQIEVPLDRLFNGDTKDISFEGENTLVVLAKSFRRFNHPINIEVFSDSRVLQDRAVLLGQSPWQLSAVQGAAIVQLLTLENIQPTRLAVVAYGPYQPIATNDDAEGQAINRRVVFLIDRTARLRERIKTVTDRHLSSKP